MRLDAFWSSDRWRAYEQAYGDPVGKRANLLATARFTTRVIDLKPETQLARVAHRLAGDPLWPFVRKSYHSLIHRAAKIYRIEVVRVTNGLSTARSLHIQESGRETRPASTWALMAGWANADGGICVQAFERLPQADGNLLAIGFAYFIIDGAWAYYASAASVVPNANHALVWAGILELRRRGVRWLEMGHQGADETEKGRNIEFFRRGFGGVNMPVTAELPE